MLWTWEHTVLVISMICDILTIAVYSYVKKLRNTLGKCVISCLLSMVMMQLLWILGLLELLDLNLYLDLINLGFHILRIFNLVMFVLTVINIRKVKREILRFEQQKETTRTCFNFDAQTYAVYLRISVIMGAAWIFNSITELLKFDDYYFGLIGALIHFFFGIIHFFLLILKRSTLKLLIDSFHERRNEKRVRAQRKKDLAQISKHIQKKNIVNANAVHLL
nr:probable G-protein coupled receptor Mth-like 7 [Drosophila suzukii]